MNNNKNLIAFVLCSAALLFAYSWLTKKYMPPPPEAVPAAISAPEALPAPPPTIPNSPSPAPQIEASEVAVSIDRRATFVAAGDLLELTWRQHDGALLQAVWKQDGTHFFPTEAIGTDGRLASADFLGIGGLSGAGFPDRPEVTDNEDGLLVAFSGPGGDRLTYFLPKGSHILDVEWHSPNMKSLYAIRSLLDFPTAYDMSGKQYKTNPFQGLDSGRVFSLEDKTIHAVTWDKMLTDPWFMFLGRRRKELPPSAPRVGMDAGLEASKRQTTHYFAAIWDLGQAPLRDTAAAPGYHSFPGPDGRGLARLYLGPKQDEYLSAFHPEGQPEKGKVFLQVMDFGFFGLIAKFFFLVLKLIQKYIPNWGWALVVFGLLVRASLWSLNTKTTVGMLRQKDLEPYQKQIQAKYAKFGSDMAKKAEMQKELMAFYKKNGHNPMGGCWPMLVQMPVFMALWSMLQNVFELRHAPWIFWIKDLSSADPFYILPALLVGSMIIQQAATPSTGDPQQRKMMMVMMPAIMGFIFASLPAGLNLYYLMFNIVGMGQFWVLKLRYKPRPVVI
ncbi:MAG: membrane protein insertase YidC [Holophagales bacterium]|jgi:YidC/Oxa1 family membrane protein insertase|nr:membrane protein insertase YidC [Holophagales bacterium]